MVLNYLWVSFFLIAFVLASIQAFFYGNMQIFQQMVKATLEASETGFQVALGLTGTMTMWLGFMKIGEKAGIANVLAFLFGPFFRKLFPDIPANHPSLAPIFMKFSMNILGLDNASTPLGIKAMKEMQTLNPTPDTASNAQIMFTVLNTTGLTLIPITIIAYRVQYGAKSPTDIFMPIMLSTSVTNITAMLMVAFVQKINIFNKIILSYILFFVGILLGTMFYFTTLPPAEISRISAFFSNFLLFLLIISFISMALFQKVNVYESFIEGAKEGFEVAIKIIPYLVGILVGIAVFRASGALEFLLNSLKYVLQEVGVEGEYTFALPVAFLKPLSGTGASGMMQDIMKTYGADSFMGYLACVFQGTTDTTLYIIAVYFGAVNIKKIRYTATISLLADIIGLTAAIYITYFFFY
jgi:spore maturation protein SpmA